MGTMTNVRIRKVGTSFGVLLPMDVINKEDLREGEEIEIVILKKNLRLLNEAFGSAKNAKFKFERDHKNRE